MNASCSRSPLFCVSRLCPSDMLAYLPLAIAFVIPAIFWRYGKRLLGDQTHPAALFILAWMATAFLLSSSEVIPGAIGIGALLWVLISFGAMALLDRLLSARVLAAKKQHPVAETVKPLD